VSKSEDDVGETSGTCGGEVKCWKSFGGGDLKERDRFENLAVVWEDKN